MGCGELNPKTQNRTKKSAPMRGDGCRQLESAPQCRAGHLQLRPPALLRLSPSPPWAWPGSTHAVRSGGPALPGGPAQTDGPLALRRAACMHLPPLHPMQESSKTFTEMQSSAHGLLNSAFWLPARFACQSKCCGALLRAAGRETGLKTAKHGVRPKHNEKQ